MTTKKKTAAKKKIVKSTIKRVAKKTTEPIFVQPVVGEIAPTHVVVDGIKYGPMMARKLMGRVLS